MYGCQDARGVEVKSSVERLADGTYAVTYTPDDVAEYTVSVKYAGQEVTGAPFSVHTAPTGNANLVTPASTSLSTSLLAGSSLPHFSCSLQSAMTRTLSLSL